jgi:hypothetical protein
LGEIDIDEITPDTDFYDRDNKTKKLSGRLYLILSNQRAFEEMLSLWKQYQRNQNTAWERGLTKFRDIFKCLRDIRHWDITDRLNEKEIKNYLQDEIEYGGTNRPIPIEIELWYRRDKSKRQKSIDNISTLIVEMSGKVHEQSVIDEIQYIGILADLPVEAI